MGKFVIRLTDYSIHFRLRVFPLIWRNTWKHNIQTNKRLTQIEEKWSTTQFYVFNLSFIFFILMSQTISVIKSSSICYFYAHHQTSDMCAGAFACNCTHQMKKTAKYMVTPFFSWDIGNFINQQPDWLRVFWLKVQKQKFSVI